CFPCTVAKREPDHKLAFITLYRDNDHRPPPNSGLNLRMAKSSSGIRLTTQTLQELKDKGFQFVLVKGYAPQRRQDHIQLNDLTLVPVVELPSEPGEKEIYAPID